MRLKVPVGLDIKKKLNANDQKKIIRHMLAKRLVLRRMPGIGFYAYCGDVTQLQLRDISDAASGSDIVGEVLRLLSELLSLR